MLFPSIRVDKVDGEHQLNSVHNGFEYRIRLAAILPDIGSRLLRRFDMLGSMLTPLIRTMLRSVQLPFCHTAGENFDVLIAQKPSLKRPCQENRTTQFMDSCGEGICAICLHTSWPTHGSAIVALGMDFSRYDRAERPCLKSWHVLSGMSGNESP